MFKFFKNRYQPTPTAWKMLGDALLYGCSAFSINSVLKDNEYLSIGFLIAGMVGHFLSNLPVDKKPDK